MHRILSSPGYIHWTIYLIRLLQNKESDIESPSKQRHEHALLMKLKRKKFRKPKKVLRMHQMKMAREHNRVQNSRWQDFIHLSVMDKVCAKVRVETSEETYQRWNKGNVRL